MHVSDYAMSPHVPVFVACDSCDVVAGGAMMQMVIAMQKTIIGVMMGSDDCKADADCSSRGGGCGCKSTVESEAAAVVAQARSRCGGS